MIIGVTGLNCAGKDTVAELLKEKNFYHISFSDILRNILKKRKKEITRENLIELGNELREKYSPSILAKIALRQMKQGENYVFSSIRNMGELELLQERDDFLLVNVTAPLNVRFERMKKRSTEQDPTTFEEFKRLEQNERSEDKHKQQLHKITAAAKVTIVNDKEIDALRKKVDKLVEDYLYKLQPKLPDWDHYFMRIAETVFIRSNCMSAKKGAVIVKDKRIISTGYNGSPRGVMHCDKGGCKRCTLRHLGKLKSGQYHEPCICCHSEENAIVQAALHGISTKDAVMYTTFTPCITCAKMIINAGIKEVIAKEPYADKEGFNLLKLAGVKVRMFK
jgi:dCMP deaminase